MSDHHVFTEHLVSPVLPETFQFYQNGARIEAGSEREWRLPNGDDVSIVVIALYDGDWERFAYVQACRRSGPRPFGDWHYGFYYTGGDVGWDKYHLDIVLGQTPSFRKFAEYVEGN